MNNSRLQFLSKDTLLIGTISLVLGIGLISSAVVYSKNQKSTDRKTSETETTSQSSATPSPTSSPVPTTDTSTITDNEFYTYANAALGLSLKLPKTAVNQHGGCQYVGAYEAFTSQYSNAPIKVFDDTKAGMLHIGFETFYQLTGTKKENGSISYTDCKVVKNTPELITAAMKTTPDMSGAVWSINYKRIQNDAELEKFVKEMHGTTCKVKEKASFSKDVFDIQIVNGDTNTDNAANKCTLNYNYVMRYNPVKKVAINWNLGQSSALFRSYDRGTDMYQPYDDQVVKSLVMQ
jgi:hypothetical protein